ncbi:MAG: hypothetical protein BGO09_11275 [Bacteroidetes bacterium 47-18]|nr:MAG: hypothetical protein BGO09_11275 [Bacteroidetes bacterium 47-18]
MCIKTDDLTVFTLSDFNTDNYGFLMFPIGQAGNVSPALLAAHKQQYYSVLYCKDGSGTVHVDKEVIALREEMIVCISPQSVCSYAIDPGAAGWMIFFSEAFFSLRYNDNVLHHFSCLRSSVVCKHLLTGEAVAKWSFIMDVMSEEYNARNTDARNVLRSYLNILLSELNRYHPVARPAEYTGSDKEQKVMAFEKLLDSNFHKEKLPSYYAGCLHISVNYLNRICNERRGMSSGDLIRKRVVLEAERLLHYTARNISEIAFELGFDSISYFTTFFKKYTGLSPEAFRKQMRSV